MTWLQSPSCSEAFGQQNGTLQFDLPSGTGKAGRVLTEDVHVGAGKDGAVLVAGLTLVHGTVLQLEVGEADLSGRDSPSEGPTWKDPNYIRRWRKHRDCGVDSLSSLLESQRQSTSSGSNRDLAQQLESDLQSIAFASSPVA